MDDPDRDLLERFVHGDPAALEALFRQFEAEVFRWIHRIVRDTQGSEDILAESFWRAYRARARFDVTQSFGAWMRRIATNASMDHLRAERRWAGRMRARENVPPPPSADPDVREAIAVAFRRLPPKLRAVAALALIEDRPLAEIAAALALPVGTVKSRVSRASARLRIELVRLRIRP